MLVETTTLHERDFLHSLDTVETFGGFCTPVGLEGVFAVCDCELEVGASKILVEFGISFTVVKTLSVFFP